MPFVISSAIAADYTQAAETFDITLFNGGMGDTVHAVTIISGTCRVLLAPSSADIIQLLEAALNAAAPPLPVGTSFTVWMTATGIVAIMCTGNKFKSDAAPKFHETQCGMVLGFATELTVSDDVFIAGLAPRHLILSCSFSGFVPVPTRAGGWERTPMGVYGFSSTMTSWSGKAQLSWHPKDPAAALAEGCDATPMRPAMEYLSLLADPTVARAWSIADVIYGASSAQCGIVESIFQTVRTSTTVNFLQGYLLPEVIQSLPSTRHRDEWPAFERCEIGLLIPASGSTINRT